MGLIINKKLIAYMLLMGIIMTLFATTTPFLAANLGISTTAANYIISIIDTYSTISTIVSILAVVIGYGIVSTGIVIIAKQLIVKFGKGYAAAW